MEQLISYTVNTNVYHCPADLKSSFSYFNGVRAAYVALNGNRGSVNSKLIQFPAAYVLSGDTVDFDPLDADKDDYDQNCVGGAFNGTPALAWQTHNLGQDILFADGHAKWYKGYDPNEMTFRYDSIHGWQ
jgi:prepilin-type processing-associated H-X9-DG protein